MQDLANSRVLVLGLGASGLAMALWARRCGAQVTVWDSRAAPPQADALHEQAPDITLLSGDLAADVVEASTLLLKSPGLSPRDAKIASALAAAAKTGIAVRGELDLFVQALTELERTRGYAPQVIAITGTNGKTTVTALTALLVERAGRRVARAGNIGPSLLATLSHALDDEDVAASASAEQAQASAVGAVESPRFACLPEVWVLELSSLDRKSTRLNSSHQ